MRAATVFALSAGLALPALATAPAAYAIDTVTRTTTSDDGRPVVELTDEALWVKVSVLASTAPDAAVLASSDDLSWQNGDSATGRGNGWTTAEALKLPEGTQLGDYPVVVEYRLPSGTVQKWTGGTYSYKLHTGVGKLSFDHKTTSYSDRNVVLSGTATTWDPSTGTRTPARAGTKVKVALDLKEFTYRSVNLTATTGADGSFSLPFTPNAYISGGTATVVEPAADTDPDVARPVPAVGVEKTSYRISADLNKYRVPKNTDVTVMGEVERLTQDGWKPFAGAQLVTANTSPSDWSATVTGQMGASTAAADGTFRYGARATYATPVYTFLRPSVYLTDHPYDQGEIAVPQPITYSNVKMTMTDLGWVRATATVNAGGYQCAGEPVYLQVSFDNGRTWSNLKYGTMQYASGTTCRIDVSNWGYVSATYRLHHYETDYAVNKDSGAVKLSRTETRFSAFSITPSRPRAGSTMTVTGTVQKKTSGTWKALSGAKVTLLFRPKGDKNWYWVTRNVATNTSGKFSFKAKNYGDGTWVMVKQDQAGYFYSESKEKYIDAI
ncbi:hypothetical protein [Streptomyces laurentii]|uniref:hypothetical protein n=1 Tax=Streptomyces laurentii TaxID=39478 RepID=UPI00368369DA